MSVAWSELFDARYLQGLTPIRAEARAQAEPWSKATTRTLLINAIEFAIETKMPGL